MSITASELALRIELAEDLLSASLVIAGDFDRDLLDAALIHDVLDQAGVARTGEVEAAIAELLASPPPGGRTVRIEIARGRAAQHARDGMLRWLVDDTDGSDNDTQAHTFYERSAFVTVEAQQVLGRIIPPTEGIDGITVTGAVLVARQGKPVTIKVDDSITIDSSGQLVTQRRGVLRRTPESASVAELLVVENNVDFSTGNINFHGDVHVTHDVGDCFVVNAGGSIEVGGLIQAATIDCGHNLLANGGFAGRDRGQLTVKGDLSAKYLDAVHGSIGGNVKVAREIINCHLVIEGSMESLHGSIIGGRLTVQGAVHVGCIGSPAAVPTELVLETVPSLDSLDARLQDLLTTFERRYAARLQELEQLHKMCVRGNIPQPIQDQLTALAASIRRLDQRLQLGRLAQQHLRETIASKRTLSVTVDRRVHAGVILTIGDRSYCITHDIKGPVTFRRDDRGTLVYVHGESAQGPLAQITTAKRVTKHTA